MGVAAKQILLNAETSAVWDFITAPSNFPRYVHGYKGGFVVTSEERGMGARYKWTAACGPFTLQSTEEVVEWREGRRVAYRGALAGITFDSSMEVRESVGGGTLLDVAIRYCVPIFWGNGVTDRLIIRPIIREYIDASLEKLGKIFHELKSTQPLFQVSGTVVRHVGRGKRLGFPTANLRCTDVIQEGIYIAETEIPGRDGRLPSLVFIGKAVTFGAEERFAELYLLDFSGDLYGKEIRVSALKKIRDNQKFDNEATLVAQMKGDEKIAREFFSKATSDR